MTIVNHVNLDEMKKTIEKARANPEETKKTATIEGEWFPQTSIGPQFSAKIKTENGEFTLSSDEPTFLGGGGSTINPISTAYTALAPVTQLPLRSGQPSKERCSRA